MQKRLMILTLAISLFGMQSCNEGPAPQPPSPSVDQNGNPVPPPPPAPADQKKPEVQPPALPK